MPLPPGFEPISAKNLPPGFEPISASTTEVESQPSVDEDGNRIIKDPKTGETTHMVPFKDGTMPISDEEWHKQQEYLKTPMGKAGQVGGGILGAIYSGMLAGPVLNAGMSALPAAAQKVIAIASKPSVAIPAGATIGGITGGPKGALYGALGGAMGSLPGVGGKLIRVLGKLAPEAEAVAAEVPEAANVLQGRFGTGSGTTPTPVPPVVTPQGQFRMALPASQTTQEALPAAESAITPAVTKTAAQEAAERLGLPLNPDGTVSIKTHPGGPILKVDPTTVGKTGRELAAQAQAMTPPPMLARQEIPQAEAADILRRAQNLASLPAKGNVRMPGWEGYGTQPRILEPRTILPVQATPKGYVPLTPTTDENLSDLLQQSIDRYQKELRK